MYNEDGAANLVYSTDPRLGLRQGSNLRTFLADIERLWVDQPNGTIKLVVLQLVLGSSLLPTPAVRGLKFGASVKVSKLVALAAALEPLLPETPAVSVTEATTIIARLLHGHAVRTLGEQDITPREDQQPPLHREHAFVTHAKLGHFCDVGGTAARYLQALAQSGGCLLVVFRMTAWIVNANNLLPPPQTDRRLASFLRSLSETLPAELLPEWNHDDTGELCRMVGQAFLRRYPVPVDLRRITISNVARAEHEAWAKLFVSGDRAANQKVLFQVLKRPELSRLRRLCVGEDHGDDNIPELVQNIGLLAATALPTQAAAQGGKEWSSAVLLQLDQRLQGIEDMLPNEAETEAADAVRERVLGATRALEALGSGAGGGGGLQSRAGADSGLGGGGFEAGSSGGRAGTDKAALNAVLRAVEAQSLMAEINAAAARPAPGGPEQVATLALASGIGVLRAAMFKTYFGGGAPQQQACRMLASIRSCASAGLPRATARGVLTTPLSAPDDGQVARLAAALPVAALEAHLGATTASARWSLQDLLGYFASARAVSSQSAAEELSLAYVCTSGNLNFFLQFVSALAKVFGEDMSNIQEYRDHWDLCLRALPHGPARMAAANALRQDADEALYHYNVEVARWFVIDLALPSTSTAPSFVVQTTHMKRLLKVAERAKQEAELAAYGLSAATFSGPALGGHDGGGGLVQRSVDGAAAEHGNGGPGGPGRRVRQKVAEHSDLKQGSNVPTPRECSFNDDVVEWGLWKYDRRALDAGWSAFATGRGVTTEVAGPANLFYGALVCRAQDHGTRLSRIPAHVNKDQLRLITAWQEQQLAAPHELSFRQPGRN